MSSWVALIIFGCFMFIDGGQSTLTKPKTTYIVNVTTGSGMNAAPASGDIVTIKLSGEKGVTEFKELRRVIKSFDKGSVSEFSITATDVGNIKKIKIKKTAKGITEAWKLKKVTIEDSKGKIYEFDCKCWLSLVTGLKKTLKPNKVIAPTATSAPSKPTTPSSRSSGTSGPSSSSASVTPSSGRTPTPTNREESTVGIAESTVLIQTNSTKPTTPAGTATGPTSSKPSGTASSPSAGSTSSKATTSTNSGPTSKPSTSSPTSAASSGLSSQPTSSSGSSTKATSGSTISKPPGPTSKPTSPSASSSGSASTKPSGPTSKPTSSIGTTSVQPSGSSTGVKPTSSKVTASTGSKSPTSASKPKGPTNAKVTASTGAKPSKPTSKTSTAPTSGSSSVKPSGITSKPTSSSGPTSEKGTASIGGKSTAPTTMPTSGPTSEGSTASIGSKPPGASSKPTVATSKKPINPGKASGPTSAQPTAPNSMPSTATSSAKPSAATSAKPAGPTSAKPSAATSAKPSAATSAKPAGPTSAKPPGPTSAKPPGPTNAKPPGPTSAKPPGPTSAKPPGPTSAKPPGSTSAKPSSSASATPPGPTSSKPSGSSSATTLGSSTTVSSGPSSPTSSSSSAAKPSGPNSAKPSGSSSSTTSGSSPSGPSPTQSTAVTSAGNSSSVPTTIPTPAQAEAAFMNDLLHEMNVIRLLHGAGSLLLEKNMSQAAQKKASTLSKRQTVNNEAETTYGISTCNLAVPPGKTAAKQCVSRWYETVKDFDWPNPRVTAKSAQFARLVWKATTHVGIGVAGTNVVVYFDPPSNEMESAKDNISPVIELSDGTSQVCPEGFIIYGKSCFKLIPVASTWAKAIEQCAQHGATLASIQSQEENTFITGMISGSQNSDTSQAWLGFNDRISESRYQWVDGSVVKYHNFLPTEPTGVGENCVALKNTKNETGWEDRKCSDTLPSLCRRPAEGPITYKITFLIEVSFDAQNATKKTLIPPAGGKDHMTLIKEKLNSTSSKKPIEFVGESTQTGPDGGTYYSVFVKVPPGSDPNIVQPLQKYLDNHNNHMYPGSKEKVFIVSVTVNNPASGMCYSTCFTTCSNQCSPMCCSGSFIVNPSVQSQAPPSPYQQQTQQPVYNYLHAYPYSSSYPNSYLPNNPYPSTYPQQNSLSSTNPYMAPSTMGCARACTRITKNDFCPPYCPKRCCRARLFRPRFFRPQIIVRPQVYN